MERPDLENDKYWTNIKIVDSIKKMYFKHGVYQKDLIRYIEYLESLTKILQQTIINYEKRTD